MPRAVVNPGPRLESLASHSDPSIPLVSIYSPSRRPVPDPDDSSDTDAVPTEPRPRPSLQIYYTSPLTSTATSAPNEELETVARTLETVVLKNRFATSGAGYERLDVYALPVEEEGAVLHHKDGRFAALADADVAVQRCVAHQRAEVATRDANDDGREWYIQRYDVAGGEWRRGVVVIRTPLAEWDWGSKEKTGRGLVLSTVMFDPTKDGPEQVLVFSGTTESENQVLIHELRHELNWQHSFTQFLD